MTLDDVADLAHELAVLRAQLAEEKSRRKLAEDAWAGMCELLGQRLKVSEEHMVADLPIGRKVTATLLVNERVFAEKGAKLDRLASMFSDTLSKAIFANLASGYGVLAERFPIYLFPVPDIRTEP